MVLKPQLIGIMALMLVFGLISSFGGFAQDDALVIGTTDSVTVLSPANSCDYWTWHTLRQIAEPLVTFMPESSEITPCLAESWQISDDETVYTFYLRQGVQFSDGAPFNAEAMKWTLERNLRLDGPSGVVRQIKDIEEITCVDEYTLRIRITEPDATFLARLADPIAPALALSPASTPSDDFANGILAGTGPYKLVECIPGERTVYEVFPEYWGGSPKFTTITEISYSKSATLRAALEAGDVDVACRISCKPEEILELQINPDLQVMRGPGLIIRYLAFNVAAPPFDDVHVRRAIGYALDREDLNNCIFSGLNTPLYSMVPPELWSHVDAFPGRDLGMALSELQEAGYSSGNPLKITLWYTPRHYGPEEVAVAEFLKSNLEETGCIEVALNAVEWGAYVDRISQGGLGLYLLDWTVDIIDPSAFLSLCLGDSPEALGTYLNRATSRQDAETYAYFTALFQAGKQTLDYDKRTAWYEDAQRALGSSAVLIPLWQNNLPTYVIAQSDIEGLIPDLFGCLPYWLIQKDEYEPDNTLHQANTIAVNEEPQAHTLSPANDIDYITFWAMEGVEYTIETFDLGGDVDTVIDLLDSDGNLVASDDDSGEEDRASRLVWTAPQYASYYVRIKSYNGSSGSPESVYSVCIEAASYSEAMPPFLPLYDTLIMRPTELDENEDPRLVPAGVFIPISPSGLPEVSEAGAGLLEDLEWNVPLPSTPANDADEYMNLFGFQDAFYDTNLKQWRGVEKGSTGLVQFPPGENTIMLRKPNGEVVVNKVTALDVQDCRDLIVHNLTIGFDSSLIQHAINVLTDESIRKRLPLKESIRKRVNALVTANLCHIGEDTKTAIRNNSLIYALRRIQCIISTVNLTKGVIRNASDALAALAELSKYVGAWLTMGFSFW